MHAYIYITYIHTYIHTCMHAYIHTYMHAYIHAYIHTDIRTYIHTYTEVLIGEVLGEHGFRAKGKIFVFSFFVQPYWQGPWRAWPPGEGRFFCFFLDE